MTDAWIDPDTRDYRLSAGTAQRDPAAGLANAVYLRLMTPRGSYWAEPTMGSRLHELAREKDLARVAVLARQYAQVALQPILDDGRATAIDITTERPGNGRLHLRIEVTDAGGGRQTFTHPVTVI